MSADDKREALDDFPLTPSEQRGCCIILAVSGIGLVGVSVATFMGGLRGFFGGLAALAALILLATCFSWLRELRTRGGKESP